MMSKAVAVSLNVLKELTDKPVPVHVLARRFGTTTGTLQGWVAKLKDSGLINTKMHGGVYRMENADMITAYDVYKAFGYTDALSEKTGLFADEIKKELTSALKGMKLDDYVKE